LNYIVGVDEVGRGCLAGPVIAAAVILKNDIPGLRDSKKLSKSKREELSSIIIQNSYYSFGSASVKEIDRINILQASLLAMKRAILNLSVEPGKILVDGTHKPDLDIVAKVYRDNLMMQFDKKYPDYYFSSHKGYGTKIHKAAIKKHGITPIHRKTFKGVVA